jgi:hypothetical protein
MNAECQRSKVSQIKSPENLLVSGLDFLSVPSQAVAGSQVAHVAAAA